MLGGVVSQGYIKDANAKNEQGKVKRRISGAKEIP